jgi:hypothetical protein
MNPFPFPCNLPIPRPLPLALSRPPQSPPISPAPPAAPPLSPAHTILSHTHTSRLALAPAGLQCRSSTFHALGAAAKALADELCGGRLVMLLEGGYDLKALGESVANTFLGERPGALGAFLGSCTRWHVPCPGSCSQWLVPWPGFCSMWLVLCWFSVR